MSGISGHLRPAPASARKRLLSRQRIFFSVTEAFSVFSGYRSFFRFLRLPKLFPFSPVTEAFSVFSGYRSFFRFFRLPMQLTLRTWQHRRTLVLALSRR
jgi:hypothetical protein